MDIDLNDLKDPVKRKKLEQQVRDRVHVLEKEIQMLKGVLAAINVVDPPLSPDMYYR